MQQLVFFAVLLALLVVVCGGVIWWLDRTVDDPYRSQRRRFRKRR